MQPRAHPPSSPSTLIFQPTTQKKRSAFIWRAVVGKQRRYLPISRYRQLNRNRLTLTRSVVVRVQKSQQNPVRSNSDRPASSAWPPPRDTSISLLATRGRQHRPILRNRGQGSTPILLCVRLSKPSSNLRSRPLIKLRITSLDPTGIVLGT